MADMRDDELRGKDIVAQDGRDLGEVVGMLVDTERWRITGLKVKVRRDRLDDLGLKRPLLGSANIDVPIDQVQAVSDRVVLRAPIGELSFTSADRIDDEPKPKERSGADKQPEAAAEPASAPDPDEPKVVLKDLLGDD